MTTELWIVLISSVIITGLVLRCLVLEARLEKIYRKREKYYNAD